MDNALVGKFPPRTLDKVERLLDLLAEIDEHSMLKDKLALHGGTAINLFMLNIPRLSVDIDLSYIGSVEKDVMLADRPTIEQSINEVARSQGYTVSGAKGGHAGRTFILNYRSQWGADHIKIDCIYMNRSPLTPIEHKVSQIRPELTVPVFSDNELIGGKVKAFFDRVKVRDLYDIANLKHVLDNAVRKNVSSHIKSFCSTHRCLQHSHTDSAIEQIVLPISISSLKGSFIPCLDAMEWCLPLRN